MSCKALVSATQRVFPHRCSTALIVGLAADKNMTGIAESLALLKPSLVLCVAPDSCGLVARGQPAPEVSAAFHTALARAGSTQDPTTLSVDSRSCQSLNLQTVNGINEAFRQVGMWVQDRQGIGCDGVPDYSLHSERAPLVCVTGSNFVVGAALHSLQSL